MAPKDQLTTEPESWKNIQILNMNQRSRLRQCRKNRVKTPKDQPMAPKDQLTTEPESWKNISQPGPPAFGAASTSPS
jgi:hypothetical protein